MKKGKWIVRIKATVHKDVYCEDCTEEQALKEPFEHATEESEVDQVDWEVKDINPVD